MEAVLEFKCSENDSLKFYSNLHTNLYTIIEYKQAYTITLINLLNVDNVEKMKSPDGFVNSIRFKKGNETILNARLKSSNIDEVYNIILNTLRHLTIPIKS